MGVKKIQAVKVREKWSEVANKSGKEILKLEI